MADRFVVVDVLEPTMLFAGVLNLAVADGLAGVALLDRDGTLIGKAGEIDNDEAMPLATLVMMGAKEAAKARLFAGEILIDRLAGRDVALGVAGRQLFVVALLGGTDGELVGTLRRDVEAMLVHDEPSFVPPASGNGGGSGPANLPLIEFGITVSRGRGQA